MIERCVNPNAISYPRYGARGIKVCESWLHSFENFLADMGERPAGTSIDRIDPSGPYSPDNTRWSTPATQARNRRSNKLCAGTVERIHDLRRVGCTYQVIGKWLGIDTSTAHRAATGRTWA